MFSTPPTDIRTRKQKEKKRKAQSERGVVDALNIPEGDAARSTSSRNNDIEKEEAERSTMLQHQNTDEQKNKEPSVTLSRTKASNVSRRSNTSSIAAQKELELAAAEAKAKIQMELIDKRLEVEKARLQTLKLDDDRSSQGTRQDQQVSNVDKWLEYSMEHLQRPPMVLHGTPPLAPPVPAIATLTQPSDPVDSIRQLAHELKNIIGNSSQQDDRFLSRLATPRDLISFSGDCIEWLHFKKAYNESTRVCQFSDNENLWRLSKALKGDALLAVTDLLIGNTPPEAVMDALEIRFGQSDCIIQKIANQLKVLPALPISYQQDIFSFYVKISNCVATIRALGKHDYLSSPELATSVISKLPSTLIGKWTDYAFQRINKGQTKLELLAEFLKDESNKLAVVGFSLAPEYKKSETRRQEPRNQESRNLQPHKSIFTTVTTVTDATCKFCKKSDHAITECKVFKRAMRKDRWRFVKTQRLCYCCLIARHDRRACPAPVCDVENCGHAHHRLLHWTKPSAEIAEGNQDGDQESAQSAPNATIAHIASHRDVVSSRSSGDVMLKVVPVKLRGPNGIVHTYALLDDGASVTIIHSDLANELGLKCDQSSTIKFLDAFGLELKQCVAKVSVEISGENSVNSYHSIVMTKVNLNLPAQDLTIVQRLQCEHLLEVKNNVCKDRVIPKLLIGEDNYFLMAPLEIKSGHKNEPYATRCRLGWTIHGYCGRTHYNGNSNKNVSTSYNINHIAHSDNRCYLDYSEELGQLNDLITKSFALESIGISTICRENTAQIRAVDILDSTARQVGDQWEVGLPFKKDNFAMHSNSSYEVAYSRLQTLFRKFQKDPIYAQRYNREMGKMFEAGYARVLADEECTDHIWYLPHFGIQNPNKPEKLRIVWDAAGKVKGTCLNDYLLTGPDLYNSLFGIMLRFREQCIAIVGDIRDMFLRIKIRPEDQHVLRFLWQDWHVNPNDNDSDVTVIKPKVCAMQSLIFGATCSPFIAQYVKNKNALKFEDLYPEAVQVILKDHFMDDCLHSCDSPDSAIKLVHDITLVHRSGGFEMGKWASNSKPVLESLPTEALAQSAIQFKHGATNATERTLGLIWHPSDDSFSFQLSLKRVPAAILDGTELPSKAKMLSIIMSIYDIHGILSPFLIRSKILLQDVHRSGIDWNCHIRPEHHASWVKWLTDLRQLEALRIPRWYHNAGTWTQCYDAPPSSADNDVIVDTQLHAFCDSSLKAYAVVIFWRFIRSDGKVLVCFAAGKSRVAPLRPMSIPRLELQGALIAARLACMVETEQTGFKPSKRYFWTDSSTVLQWLRSDPRTFKTYVAQRLGELDELTKVSEWRYVPSKLNVADIATKEDALALKLTDVWFQGPNFLRLPEDDWPTDSRSPKKAEEASCEERNVNLITLRETCLPNEANVSSWMILLRCMARILFLFRRKQGMKSHMDVELMMEAEEHFIRKCQSDTFAEEIHCVRQNKAISSNSRISKLTPYLDEKGLLRVGGWIDKTVGVSMAAMRPVILDGQHRITRLLVEYYHRRALHGAHELVVNELRQRYWIVQLRPTVRAVGARCLFCHYRRATPKPQRMADLPAARLQHGRRPFSFTGLDYFGPMEITVGRRRQKMYGVLFTCLIVRAVHIELTDSLTADGTIMALRRMSARRGCPQVIYSDNGTCLRGADVELKRNLAELNAEQLRDDGLQRGVEWRFLPPAAPEMAGATERMVRTVKTSLKVILKSRAPQLETLSTLMAEVEALVNSRPITHVSSDPSYPEALTPNHFLIGFSSNGPQFGRYDDVDLSLRKRWRIAQRLTDMFWGRWIREYLPTLLPRQKWTSEQRPLQSGDYVILVQESKIDRGCWRHGVVSATHAGHDGRVRIVDVRTRTGTLRRPVTRVALLSPKDASADS